MRKIIQFASAVVGAFAYQQTIGQRNTIRHLPASEVYVVDSDTTDHKEDRYRLVGFDTPETYRPQCDAELELGLQAKERLTELINRAGAIELEIEPHLDVHDRFLAVGRTGARNVASILISEKLAQAYWGGEHQSWCN